MDLRVVIYDISISVRRGHRSQIFTRQTCAHEMFSHVCKPQTAHFHSQYTDSGTRSQYRRNSHFLSQQSVIVLAMTTLPLSSYSQSSITETLGGKIYKQKKKTAAVTFNVILENDKLQWRLKLKSLQDSLEWNSLRSWCKMLVYRLNLLSWDALALHHKYLNWLVLWANAMWTY